MTYSKVLNHSQEVYLSEVFDDDAPVIRSGVQSSEERVDVLFLGLMRRWLRNVADENCEILRTSPGRRLSSDAQRDDASVRSPQHVVGHEGNPEHADEEPPYLGASGLHVAHAQVVESAECHSAPIRSLLMRIIPAAPR